MDDVYRRTLFSHYILCAADPLYNGCCREDGYFISFAVLDTSAMCEAQVMHVAVTERMSWCQPSVTTRMWAVVVDGDVSAWMTDEEVDVDLKRVLDAADDDAWIDSLISQIM